MRVPLSTGLWHSLLRSWLTVLRHVVGSGAVKSRSYGCVTLHAVGPRARSRTIMPHARGVAPERRDPPETRRRCATKEEDGRAPRIAAGANAFNSADFCKAGSSDDEAYFRGFRSWSLLLWHGPNLSYFLLLATVPEKVCCRLTTPCRGRTKDNLGCAGVSSPAFLRQATLADQSVALLAKTIDLVLHALQ